jgi:glutamyl-tRNA synthetase
MPNAKPARTRFAPSPTGRIHLAHARTALYDYLLARQTHGQFILRLEDTDVKRFVDTAEQELKHSLRWLGLQWDEGIEVHGPYSPYTQSARKEIYQKYARQLIEKGNAYYCFCSPARLERIRQEQQKNKQPSKYDGFCRHIDPVEAAARVANGEKHVVRFKMPEEGSITVHDGLRGDITVENRTLDDYILVKSDGLALYHLAAMADDYEMKITHVIRGAEWLSTFPLHMHILRAFGWPEPQFFHLSIFLSPSGKGKMSKRKSPEGMKDGKSIFITDLEHSGYLPEAVINWVALMGWSYDDRTEFFTMDDLVEKFSLERLNPSPAAINFTKLDHFNGLHIRNLSVDDLGRRLKPFFERAGYVVDDDQLQKMTPLLQPRIVTLDDAPDMGGFFFKQEVSPQPTELVGKNMTPAESALVTRRAYQVLEALEAFTHEAAEPPLRLLATEMHLEAGQLFGILRAAITGQTVSPPLFESMMIVGRDKVLERLRHAIQVLETMD